jgi:hypothetical protein
MPNHPNRNWRRVAREAAGLHAMRWRMALPASELPHSYEDGNRLQADIEAAFLAGYEAGRRSTRPPQT